MKEDTVKDCRIKMSCQSGEQVKYHFRKTGQISFQKNRSNIISGKEVKYHFRKTGHWFS